MVACEARHVAVNAFESRVPETDHGLNGVGLFKEKQPDSSSSGLQRRVRVRRELALGDNGVNIGASRATAVGKEVDKEFAAEGRGGGARRTIETVVRRKTGPPGTARVLNRAGIGERSVRSTRGVRRWVMVLP